MYEELLENIGLTKNESLVYLALLKIGKSKSGVIVKEAGISAGKIYDTLNRLLEKGLVNVTKENGIKKFTANNPKTLVNYVKEKEEKLKFQEKEIEKMIPSFQGLINKEDLTESVSLTKGLRGVSVIVNETLEKANSEILIMGVRSTKKESFNNFWRGWHKRRVKLRKESKIIFVDKENNYFNFFKKLKHTKAKVISHISPSAIMIIDDNTFIFSYEESLNCIHIKSKSVSESFKNFFNDIWKIAKS